ncbi:MAG: aquaporin [Oscillospiraceae bacterium]|nr:aquaporin [Oscillospiraceae bacterium]
MNQRTTRTELTAEFLGSMSLVMAAVASMIFFVYVLDSHKSIALLANAIAVAFVLMALIEMFSAISGAHFNPVVTIIMTLDKRIGAKKAVFFILAQMAGGLAGTAVTHLMFWDEVGVVFAVSQNVRSHAYFGEVIGTFILILAILMLIKAKSTHIPMMVAFLVGGQLIATSSTMFANPQVTIARMLTATTSGIRPTDALVFIAMQVIGAVLAYAVYQFAFAKEKES